MPFLNAARLRHPAYWNAGRHEPETAISPHVVGNGQAAECQRSWPSTIVA
jgi:hypothetical protein